MMDTGQGMIDWGMILPQSQCALAPPAEGQAGYGRCHQRCQRRSQRPGGQAERQNTAPAEPRGKVAAGKLGQQEAREEGGLHQAGGGRAPPKLLSHTCTCRMDQRETPEGK